MVMRVVATSKPRAALRHRPAPPHPHRRPVKPQHHVPPAALMTWTTTFRSKACAKQRKSDPRVAFCMGHAGLEGTPFGNSFAHDLPAVPHTGEGQVFFHTVAVVHRAVFLFE